MDLTEAEGIKKRQQEYTEELYKKDLNDSDNHDCVITHLQRFILECEVKWALGSISTNKASGSDGIPAELLQILKDDAVKVLHSICQQIWKTQQWPQDWKMSSFQALNRTMPKNVQLLHDCTHLTCQQSNAQNSPSEASIVHELRTFRSSCWIQKRQRNHRSNYQHMFDHQKSWRVPEKHLFLLH